MLGFVGRLSVEKNISLLPKIDTKLRAQGISVEWLIIGKGSEEGMLWLWRELSANANFAGVLRGDALAVAYANMDLLVFSVAYGYILPCRSRSLRERCSCNSYP